MGINQSRLHAYRVHLEAKKDFASAKETISRILKHQADMEDKLFQLFPQLAQHFVDTPLQKTVPISPVTPPPATISVTQKNGLSFVSITPPNLTNPLTPALYAALLKANPNLAQSPIFHQLQSSSTNTFDATANVINYNATGQVYLTLPDTNAHWRISSSFDNVNFNEPGAGHLATALP